MKITVEFNYEIEDVIDDLEYINIKVGKEYIDCIEIRYTKDEITFFCCLSSSDVGFDMMTGNIIDLEVIIIKLFNSVINKILS